MRYITALQIYVPQFRCTNAAEAKNMDTSYKPVHFKAQEQEEYLTYIVFGDTCVFSKK